MPTLTTVPVYPPPNRETVVTLALTESGTNYIRVWCTAAPPGSGLRKKIDGTADPLNRVKIFEGDGGSDAPMRETFDVGGKYTFVAQEYTKGASSYGGGYQNSPDGNPEETKVGNETPLSLYIGQRIVLPVGTGSDTASLVVWVWDETIRATSIAVHGEMSPAIQATSPTARMQAVMESATVIAALAALAGVAVATARGTISTLVSGYLTAWNAHLADATVHQDADAANLLPVGFSIAGNAAGLKDFVNEALRKMRQHYTNDAADLLVTAGRDSGDYHNVSGKRNDRTNAPLVESASGPDDAYIGLAELYRSYSLHRVSASPSGVHDSADSTNTLASTTAAKLFELHRTVLGILASTSPTVPATQSTGAMILIQELGGVETPLEE